MPRRLKTYQTTSGFFDLAVAVPSMKAALEAWGAKIDFFRMGTARQTDDPAIVTATMAKPGVVLKRPVGSKEPFCEGAKFPPRRPGLKGKAQQRSPRAPASRAVPAKPARQATGRADLALENERKKRERARAKAEALRQKEQARREAAIAAGKAAIEKAEREHQNKLETIARKRAALDAREEEEEHRWERQRKILESRLRDA